ncbi:hypothetical protein EG329_000474 [Mollisiaceae sp. DMI_Dod_QoI]|nr:hypothetical protein EG329_000474 [Helotiales sp. DMI_Dod_QoI]
MDGVKWYLPSEEGSRDANASASVNEDKAETVQSWLDNIPSLDGLSEPSPMANFTIPYRCYPPPSNNDYTLIADSHDLKLTYRARQCSSEVMYHHHSSTNRAIVNGNNWGAEPKETIAKSSPRLNGERLANTIQWNKNSFCSTTCESNGPIYPSEQARTDFVKMINQGAKLEHCKVCDKKHIPPGPPVTLADRDTCGSYLPEWFPKDRYTRPWDTYRELINTIAMLESYEKDPSAIWDKQLHEADDKWSVLGRKAGGWWRCRSGADAIEAELWCWQCQRPRTKQQWEQEQQDQRRSNMDRLNLLNEWVAKQMKTVADRDKAIALAMIRDQPMCLLTPPPKEPVPPLRIPYDSDDDEGGWTLGPYAGQIPWKVKGKGKAEVDENLRGSESPDLRPTELHHNISSLNLGEFTYDAGLAMYDGSTSERPSVNSGGNCLPAKIVATSPKTAGESSGSGDSGEYWTQASRKGDIGNDFANIAGTYTTTTRDNIGSVDRRWSTRGSASSDGPLK